MYDPVRSASLRKLGVVDRAAFRDHLLRLDPESRRCRFGGPTTDWFIEHYAERSVEDGTVIHGVFLDGRLIGCGELAIWDPASGEAEAAFSVEARFQGIGFGTRLMRRVLLSARNRGVGTIRMSCLSANSHMQHLARRAGADILFERGEAVALLVTERASAGSHAVEAVRDTRVRIRSLCHLWARPIYVGFGRAF